MTGGNGKFPRILLAAGASGSGKTTITCGILQALKNRGLTAASFKCGPDYIDPMFHERVLKTKSRNLDTFFTDGRTTRRLFAANAAGADVSVMEGVMGYYDGLGGMSDRASAYDLARVTETPAVLIVNTRGMSQSVLAYIRGFLTYRSDSYIRGIILNQMPQSLYPEMKRRIEEELGVRVYGYVPKMADTIPSRHLGLVVPSEIALLEEKMQKLADTLEESLDLDGLLALARSARPFAQEETRTPPFVPDNALKPQIDRIRAAAPVIAVARDEAFCFLYEDNLQLLRDLGAQVKEFSPLHDSRVLDDADGMLLYGGYPELYARQLSENESMLGDVKEKIAGGMPCMAECGGFLYLHRTMEDMHKKKWRMAGVVDADAFRTEKLARFGYVELRECADGREAVRTDDVLRGHEFHYFDSTDNGDAYLAGKPLAKREWKCIHKRGGLLAGFPHLYYYSNPKFALDFCARCAAYQKKRREGK